MFSESVIAAISLIFVFLGLIGSVMPFLPGPPLALIGLVIYGYAGDFQIVSLRAIIVFAALTLFSAVFDFAAPALFAKGYKASRYGMYGALLGGVFGAVLLGPLGIIAGPFAGGFVGEYYAVRNTKKAWRAAWAAFVGFVVGGLVKILITLSMAGYLVYALLR